MSVDLDAKPGVGLASSVVLAPSPVEVDAPAIRVGVIGYGYWGPNLVRNLVELPGFDVSVVSDRRPQRLMQARQRDPLVKTTTDCN